MNRRKWIEAGAALLSGLGVSGPVNAGSTQQNPVFLSLNECPFGPSPRATAAIRSQLDHLFRYTGEEAPLLLGKIAAREQVSTDQIVLGEILNLLGYNLAQTGGPGGEFVYTVPGYTALVDAVAPAGGVVVGVPLTATLENDLGALSAAIGPKTRAVYLINPHNPTGTVSDSAAFKRFVAEASQKTTVIVDEAYLEFEPDFAERSVVDLSRAGANVVVFRTFGKIYGLAGLAIGYAIAPKALASRLKQAGIGDPHTLDRLALVAASASLDDPDYIALTRAKVIAERQKWNSFFAAKGLRHADSRGNFVFFETPLKQADVVAALRQRNIIIGRAFPGFEHWLRITIGLPEENAVVRQAIGEILAR